MKPELMLGLKDALISVHNGYIDNLENEDLYGVLKECIYYIECNEPKYDRQFSEIKELLYQAKKIRNDQAHIVKMIDSEEELRQCLTFKRLFSIIIDKQYLNFNNPDVISYIGNVDMEVRYLGESRFAKAGNPLNHADSTANENVHAIANYLADAVERISILYDLIYNIKISFVDEDKTISKDRDEIITSESALSDIMRMQVDDIEVAIYQAGRAAETDLLEIINRLNMTKKNLPMLPRGIEYEYSDKIRADLIKLRERMLRETNVPREHSILRKTVLEKIMRYRVNTYEKYATYIEDVVYKYKAVQEKYLNDIFDIMSQ